MNIQKAEKIHGLYEKKRGVEECIRKCKDVIRGIETGSPLAHYYLTASLVGSVGELSPEIALYAFKCVLRKLNEEKEKIDEEIENESI